jgi:O-antigen/teichoic acid export membrane protein
MLGDAFVARGAQACFSAVSIFAVAHKVPVSTYGVYAPATAFSAMLLTFMDVGSSAVVVRDAVASDNLSGVAQAYVHTRALLSLVSCFIGAALVPLIFPEQARDAAYLSLITLILSGVSMISPLGQLSGSMRTYKRVALAQGAATLGATLAAVVLLAHPSAVVLVLTNVFGALIGTGLALAAAGRIAGRLAGKPNWLLIRGMARGISLLGLATIITVTYANVDNILLLNLAGSKSAGVYGAAVRLVSQAAIVPAAVLAPVSPMLARQIRSGHRVIASLDQALAKIESMLGLAVALAAIGAAYWATLLLLGKRYERSADIVCLLAITQSWAITAYVSTVKVIQARQERRYIAVTVVGLCINVGVNVVLIPLFKEFGAAYATVVTELATVLGYCWIARGVSSNARTLRVCGSALVASGCAGGMLLALRSGEASIATGTLLAFGASSLAGWYGLSHLRDDSFVNAFEKQ